MPAGGNQDASAPPLEVSHFAHLNIQSMVEQRGYGKTTLVLLLRSEYFKPLFGNITFCWASLFPAVSSIFKYRLWHTKLPHSAIPKGLFNIWNSIRNLGIYSCQTTFL